MPLSQIRIVHQDDALLVVDKPTLLLSVPGRADDNKDCLVTRLQENGYPEARIVHRLDWETSGLMVLARDADSHRELSRQFHDRETEKAYTALCWGLPELDSGRIELPLRYDPPTKPRHVVDFEHGRHALTFWRRRSEPSPPRPGPPGRRPPISGTPSCHTTTSFRFFWPAPPPTT